MSIPTPFNPLGTLGANPLAGYVTDGLILAFDALLEPPGTRHYLTNWVSGTQCEFSEPLTVADGSISNEGEIPAKFNPYPMQPIDGHPAFGLGYSADVCAERAGSGMSFNPWGQDFVMSTSYVPGFQFLNEERKAIRVSTRTDTFQYVCELALPLGVRVSAHVEFLQGNYIRVNGESMGNVTNDWAAMPGAVARINNGAIIYAYRLYDRRLSIVEQMQNYAMDKKRFNLP